MAFSVLQVIMVDFGGTAMEGLSGELWGIFIWIAFGVGSLPIQQVINVLYAFFHRYWGLWRVREGVSRSQED